MGAAVDAASCYGVGQAWFSGDRVQLVGSLDRAVLGQCHRSLTTPTRHCTNLAAAIYTVLYDRHAKRVRAGLEAPHTAAETRGFGEPDHMVRAVGVRWR